MLLSGLCELCRYCYRLQAFSGSAVTDSRHDQSQRRQALFFPDSSSLQAVITPCLDASNGSPDFSTP
ncbi:hypothetical protein C2U43_17500 [Citrobacter freundii complex sp. CFNIH9]|nr:hypothetical protein C2U43_17500 [Citrobacter freundii complex sp. CFNIH9]